MQAKELKSEQSLEGSQIGIMNDMSGLKQSAVRIFCKGGDLLHKTSSSAATSKHRSALQSYNNLFLDLLFGSHVYF